MSKYTMELRDIIEDKNLALFDFCYDFYEESLRYNFEQKFADYFRYNEIGFETVGRFKQRLRSKLNMIMPRYTQLYQTQVRAEGIDFMLNKDLIETMTRELNKEDRNKNNSSSVSGNVSSASGSDGSVYKESNIDNGLGSLDLNSLTGLNDTKNDFNSNAKNDTTSSNNATGENIGNEREVITNKSQGNIGITSSADLLEKWRKVIINIDEMIIEDCEDLFMMVY